MRVITTLFSIESRLLTEGDLKVGAVCNAIPTTVREVISTYREWQGVHEGANRIELLESRIRGPKARRSKKAVHLSLSIYVNEATCGDCSKVKE